MKLLKLLIIVLSVLPTLSYLYAQSDNPPVDEIIESFMKKWEIPGGTFAMALNGKIIYSKGYGYADESRKEPVTTKSLFRIASCSKPFTAVAVMKLIEEGKLKLTDKVFGREGILDQPQYQSIKDKRVLEISVINLLEHTGGWDSKIESDPMFMSQQIIAAEGGYPPAMQEAIIKYTLSRMMLNHNPGTVYAYSNFGYCVLGRVIEKVTGQGYESYVRENILIPSGSNSMQLGKNLEQERFPNEVTYYGCPGEMTAQSVYETGREVPFPYGGFNIEAMDSHGEWIASAEDLVNFMIAVGENKLISAESYKIMTTTPDIANDNYAKGWAVNSGNIFHEGSLPGTSSEMVKATNGYTWAVIFNKRNNSEALGSEMDGLGWSAQKFLK